MDISQKVQNTMIYPTDPKKLKKKEGSSEGASIPGKGKSKIIMGGRRRENWVGEQRRKKGGKDQEWERQERL